MSTLSRSNKKDRKFCGVLYLENKAHEKVLEKITRMTDCQWAYILHDADEVTNIKKVTAESGYYTVEYYDEEEQEIKRVTCIKNGDKFIKKPHVHFCFRYPRQRSPRYIAPVAKELGVEENLLNICKDFDSYLAYMTHKFNPEKYQYETEEIITNDKEMINNVYHAEKETDAEILGKILNVITDTETVVSLTDILMFAINNNYVEIFRKYQYTIKNCVDEKNKRQINKTYEEYISVVNTFEKRLAQIENKMRG